MKTKQDLLDRMAALRACPGSTVWVTAQEGSALEIGLACDRPDWLIWLIGRIDPLAIADFARRCADRAKGYANASASAYANAAAVSAYANASASAYAAAFSAYANANAAYAAEAAEAANAAAYADRAAAYAFSAADRAARYAADATYAADADERQAQLTDLRAMWVGVCT